MLRHFNKLSFGKYLILLPVFFLFYQTELISQKKEPRSLGKPRPYNKELDGGLGVLGGKGRPYNKELDGGLGDASNLKVLMPEGVTSSRYFVFSPYTDPSYRYPGDSVSRKLEIEETFKQELNSQFKASISNFLLPFMAFSVLITYLLMKSTFSNKLNNVNAKSKNLLLAFIAIPLVFLGLYIYNGLIDARDKDFEWYILETWYKGLFLTGMIVGINYIFTRLTCWRSYFLKSWDKRCCAVV